MPLSLPGGPPKHPRSTMRASLSLLALQEGLSTPPSPPDFSRPSRPLPALREGLPTPAGPSGGSTDPSRPTCRDFRPLPAYLDPLRPLQDLQN